MKVLGEMAGADGARRPAVHAMAGLDDEPDERARSLMPCIGPPPGAGQRMPRKPLMCTVAATLARMTRESCDGPRYERQVNMQDLAALEANIG